MNKKEYTAEWLGKNYKFPESDEKKLDVFYDWMQKQVEDIVITYKPFKGIDY